MFLTLSFMLLKVKCFYFLYQVVTSKTRMWKTVLYNFVQQSDYISRQPLYNYEAFAVSKLYISDAKSD